MFYEIPYKHTDIHTYVHTYIPSEIHNAKVTDTSNGEWSTPLIVQSVHCAPYRVASGVYECMFTNTGMAVESVPIAGTQSGDLSAKVTL